MDTNNLTLWKSVEKTDPKHTKKVSFGRTFTSIAPQYQIMMATEQFGPYGSGWGFESCEMDFSQAEAMGLVLVKAVFFFVIDEKRHSFPINNSWPTKQSQKPDAKIDPDFIKKAETNTMSKALSKLGFSADIFMGEFDNPDYVQAIGNEFALEKAEDKIEEKAKQDEEHEGWVNSSLNLIGGCQTENELKKLYTNLVRKANLYKDKVSVVKFTSAKDKRKAELESE